MASNRVEVTINSRQYAVLSSETDEYISKLANHINDKVKIVLNGGQNVMGERPIILAALNICDEYYKCLEAGRVLKIQLQTATNKLNLANAKLQKFDTSASQLSFEEDEAAKKAVDKAAELEKQLTVSGNKLKAAEDKIYQYQHKIDEAEKNVMIADRQLQSTHDKLSAMEMKVRTLENKLREAEDRELRNAASDDNQTDKDANFSEDKKETQTEELQPQQQQSAVKLVKNSDSEINASAVNDSATINISALNTHNKKNHGKRH